MPDEPGAHAPTPPAAASSSHVSVKEAATIIGRGTTFVRSLFDNGELEGFRAPGRGGHARRLYTDSLNTWLTNRDPTYRRSAAKRAETDIDEQALSQKHLEAGPHPRHAGTSPMLQLSPDTITAVVAQVEARLMTANERRLVEENISLREAGLLSGLAFAEMADAWKANDEAQRHRRRATRKLRKAINLQRSALAQFYLPAAPPQAESRSSDQLPVGRTPTS